MGSSCNHYRSRRVLGGERFVATMIMALAGMVGALLAAGCDGEPSSRPDGGTSMDGLAGDAVVDTKAMEMATEDDVASSFDCVGPGLETMYPSPEGSTLPCLDGCDRSWIDVLAPVGVEGPDIPPEAAQGGLDCWVDAAVVEAAACPGFRADSVAYVGGHLYLAKPYAPSANDLPCRLLVATVDQTSLSAPVVARQLPVHDGKLTVAATPTHLVEVVAPTSSSTPRAAIDGQWSYRVAIPEADGGVTFGPTTTASPAGFGVEAREVVPISGSTDGCMLFYDLWLFEGPLESLLVQCIDGVEEGAPVLRSMVLPTPEPMAAALEPFDPGGLGGIQIFATASGAHLVIQLYIGWDDMGPTSKYLFVAPWDEATSEVTGPWFTIALDETTEPSGSYYWGTVALVGTTFLAGQYAYHLLDDGALELPRPVTTSASDWFHFGAPGDRHYVSTGGLLVLPSQPMDHFDTTEDIHLFVTRVLW